ncbi:MAG TPA: hypothetical protein VLA36_11435 [Longimicrobiales bacterium]|nr:hypothetical protein [Longimicrobiales bacterium]
MRLQGVLALVGLLGAGGCYHYLPSSPQEVAPGQAVRLRLTADEAAKYVDLRLDDPRVVEGNVADRSASGVMLDATVGVNDATTGSRALIQRLNVPFSGVVEVELKVIDRTKTGFLVGGGAVIAGLAIAKAGGAFGGSEGSPIDNPEARRLPLFKIRLPF